jgi:hypothetical protein
MSSKIIKALIILIIGFLLGYSVADFKKANSDNTATNKKIIPLSPTLKYAQEITVPFTEFENSTLKDAVLYLRAITRKGIDTDGHPHYRLNFIFVDPEQSAKPINLRLDNVRLDILCQRIAEVAGVSVRFDDDAIVFTSAKESQ